MARFIVVWMVAASLTGALVTHPVGDYPTALDQNKCKDITFRERLVGDLVKSRGQNQDLYNLVSGYFTKYLNDCGFEASFTNARQETSTGKSNDVDGFDKYLMGEFWTQAEGKNSNEKFMARQLVQAIGYVDDHLSSAQIYETCESIYYLRNDLSDVRSDGYDLLKQMLENKLTSRIKTCREIVLNTVNEFKKDGSKWNLLESFWNHIKNSEEGSTEERVKTMIEKNSFTGSTSDLKQACRQYDNELYERVLAITFSRENSSEFWKLEDIAYYCHSLCLHKGSSDSSRKTVE